MKLNKTCKCCNTVLHTSNVKHIGRNEIGLWFNCKCGSTGLLLQKGQSLKLMRIEYKNICKKLQKHVI